MRDFAMPRDVNPPSTEGDIRSDPQYDGDPSSRHCRAPMSEAQCASARGGSERPDNYWVQPDGLACGYATCVACQNGQTRSVDPTGEGSFIQRTILGQ